MNSSNKMLVREEFKRWVNKTNIGHKNISKKDIYFAVGEYLKRGDDGKPWVCNLCVAMNRAERLRRIKAVGY